MATPLYGGALTAGLPNGWIDASDLRPVPDNQEVWMERAGAGRSLIIELMERPVVADVDCAPLHFEDMATGNDAKRSAVVSSQQLAGASTRLGCDPPCFHLHGVQTLAAGEGADGELQLQVHLVVARLAEFETDLLVSITRPINQSSAKEEAGAGTEEVAADAALALSILDSLVIRDKGLFGS